MYIFYASYNGLWHYVYIQLIHLALQLMKPLPLSVFSQHFDAGSSFLFIFPISVHRTSTASTNQICKHPNLHSLPAKESKSCLGIFVHNLKLVMEVVIFPVLFPTKHILFILHLFVSKPSSICKYNQLSPKNWQFG